jgi:excisionase family DNA binding protein
LTLAEATAPRRMLSRREAALYVGVSCTTFDNMIEAGLMPKALRIGRRILWDLHDLDGALDALRDARAAEESANPWDGVAG